MFKFDKSLVWFRRDLRSFDHAALYHALKQSRMVFCAFVFDNDILDVLPRWDRRVEFIHASIIELNRDLCALGGGLIVQHGKAVRKIPGLARRLSVDAVFANRDYEPRANERDDQIAATWLSELIWRDFFFMILHHHPHVIERVWKPEYDAIQWESGAEAESCSAHGAKAAPVRQPGFCC